MTPELQAWLATHTEDPIDPDERICDPHHHLWDHPTNRYLVPELHADTGAGHNVVRTVFVECMSGYRTDGPEAMRPVGETVFVAEAALEAEAAGGATIDGIVAYADLTLGAAVGDVLDAHDDAGGGRFRGIRHATSWDPDPEVHNAHTKPTEGLATTDAFDAGLGALAQRGHSFDAWMYHPQLPELVTVADRHPDLTIILDHLGGPVGVGPYAGRRDEVLEHWRPVMAQLAERPNVFLKVGGIGMA
ncbi:MAG: amidohydrolase family protein, partial [Actinomycetota bacterium]